jgi:hypothetical protein
MQLTLPLLVAIVGAVVYAVTNNKAAELGRIAYFVGLLWFLYSFSHGALRL